MDALLRSDTTPPNKPTFGVRFDDDLIKEIVEIGFPGWNTKTIRMLGSGQSFNNRLYFIRVEPREVNDSEVDSTKEIVLKVCGQFWSRSKVQNEVASLSLVDSRSSTFLPTILAYSEEGYSTRVWSEEFSQFTASKPIDCKGRSWLLMTKVPGRQMTYADLEGPSAGQLMKDMARHLATWRKSLPVAANIGNINFAGSGFKGSLPYTSISDIPQVLQIGGILISWLQPSAPLRTRLAYYEFRLEAQLASLRLNRTYALNKHRLSTLIQEFIDTKLKDLALFSAESERPFVFTHYDLSPKNSLVSENENGELKLEGLVDLEFSGFFPEEEEFTNNMAGSQSYFPAPAWQTFMEELERLGVSTPLTGMGMDPKCWDQACTLVRMIENIAPWWVAESNDELEAELNKAFDIVRAGLEFLSKD